MKGSATCENLLQRCRAGLFCLTAPGRLPIINQLVTLDTMSDARSRNARFRNQPQRETGGRRRLLPAERAGDRGDVPAVAADRRSPACQGVHTALAFVGVQV